MAAVYFDSHAFPQTQEHYRQAAKKNLENCGQQMNECYPCVKKQQFFGDILPYVSFDWARFQPVLSYVAF